MKLRTRKETNYYTDFDVYKEHCDGLQESEDESVGPCRRPAANVELQGDDPTQMNPGGFDKIVEVRESRHAANNKKEYLVIYEQDKEWEWISKQTLLDKAPEALEVFNRIKN